MGSTYLLRINTRIKNFILTYFLLIYCIPVFFIPSDTAAGNLNKPFDLRIEQIARLNSSPIPKAMRKELDEFVKTRIEYPEYPDQLPNILNGKQYLQIFSKIFMLLEGEAGHFGGYNLTVAIDPENTRYFWIWIYNIGDSENEEWDIVSIEEIFFDSERVSQLEEIKSQKYAQFWH